VDRTNQSSSGQPRRRLGTPSNVHPERLSGPAHGVFVWGTILLVWLVSLLPWRLSRAGSACSPPSSSAC